MQTNPEVIEAESDRNFSPESEVRGLAEDSSRSLHLTCECSFWGAPYPGFFWSDDQTASDQPRMA